MNFPVAVPKAYNELINRLLAPQDRQTLETVVGAMLSGSDPQTVIMCGPPGTGKTTLMGIIKRLQTMTAVGTGTANVIFRHNRVRYSQAETEYDSFVFVEILEPVPVEGFIFIETTGERLPVNKYYVLMDQIDSELDKIAEHCINVYRNNTQENNR